MTKHEWMLIADYSQESELTLDELCELCQLSSPLFEELISHGILTPRGEIPAEWVFDLVQLRRAKIAMRLQRDLEVNFAGAALVLDLLEEIQELRRR